MKLKDWILYDDPEPMFVYDDLVPLCDGLSCDLDLEWVRKKKKFPTEEFLLDMPEIDFNKSSVIFFYHKEIGFINLLRKCAEHPESKFILVQMMVRNDITFDFKIEIPDNVLKIYVKNSDWTDPRVEHLIIGRDFRNIHSCGNIKFDRKELNTELVYSNFSWDTNMRNRVRIFHKFHNKYWVTSRRVKKMMKYPISRQRYLHELYQHRFVIAPDGQGFDCFRTWESIYCKAIPIVQRNVVMRKYDELPILFTRRYGEISPDYLNDKYEEMMETDYNFERIYRKYYVDKLTRDKESLNES